MKKLLIILTLLIFALPVYSIDWDIKGRLRFGKEVSVVVPEGVPADYTEYLNSLNEKFKDTWSPANHNKDLRVVLNITINSAGDVESMKLIRTSGFRDVDRSAFGVIKENSPYEPFSDSITEPTLSFNVVFNRYILGHPAIKANDTIIVLTECSLSNYTYKKLKTKQDRKACKKYLKLVTKELRDTLILSDYPRRMMSYFKFDITRYGNIENIKVTATSNSKKFDKDVTDKLQSIVLPAFPEGFTPDKITVEYRIGNNPSLRPRYNPVRDAGSVILGVPLF